MVALCKIWLLDLRRLVRSQNGAGEHINGSCSVRMHFEGTILHSMIGLFELSVEMYFFLLAKDPLGSSAPRKRVQNVWKVSTSRTVSSITPQPFGPQ
jgi:hypothetical protein